MNTCAPATSLSIRSVTRSTGGAASGGAVVAAGAAARRDGRGCSTAGGAVAGGGGGTTTGAGVVAAGVCTGAGLGREITYKPIPLTTRRMTTTAMMICRFTRRIVTQAAVGGGQWAGNIAPT